jgi:hypothetical protein
MKKSKIIIIIMVLVALGTKHLALSQEWTEPVQVNTLQGLNNNPDFCIGNNGTIHCVWSYRVIGNHRVIYYSKSNDDGLTWSNPENVTQNDSLWMENPQIVADSENNLHLSYDYNVSNPGGTLIMHRSYNGETWSGADTVSPGWYAARHSRLVIDNNDLLYCFWFHDFQNGVFMYRTLDNGVWGELVIPYFNNDLFFFQKGVVDENNNIYCTGIHHYEGQSAYQDRVMSFNLIDSSWQPWVELSDNKSWGGNDIALFSSNQPAIVWGQDINDSIPPTAGTLFSFNNGTNWSTPELIAEHSDEQAITIDMLDRVHILHHEDYYDNEKSLVHYQKINDEWTGEMIEENQYGFANIKLISKEDFIHMIYLVGDTVFGGQSETSIKYRKYDIITNIEQDELFKAETFSVYPNPAAGSLNISFNIKEQVKTEIKVFDLQGKLIKTLLNTYKSPGKYKLRWDTTDNEGSYVKPGTYFIRIKTGKYIMTKRVIIVN